MGCVPNMSDMNTKQKLRAEDVEDLAIIAALTQDAVTRIGDMAYDSTERTFMLACTRFRREAPALNGMLTQTGSALIFGCIKSVQHRGIPADNSQQDIVLLTIATEPGVDSLYRINLVFDGGGEIRLTSDCLHCRFEDFGSVTVSDRPPIDHFSSDEISDGEP